MNNSNLTQEINQLHAELCSAIAEPTRLLLLYTLGEGKHTVTELAQALELPQPTISRHLKVLRDRGLVYAKRRGAAVEYGLADPRVIQALDLLRGVLHDRIQHRADLIEEIQS